jgi:hypothetical protein
MESSRKSLATRTVMQEAELSNDPKAALSFEEIPQWRYPQPRMAFIRGLILKQVSILRHHKQPHPLIQGKILEQTNLLPLIHRDLSTRSGFLQHGPTTLKPHPVLFLHTLGHSLPW